MIKVQIVKSGTVTNEATFETQELANEWLARHEGMGTFGQKASSYEQVVEIAPAVINEDGTVAQEAVTETQTVLVPGYTVVVTDLTEELERTKRNEEAQAFLDSTDWKVLRHQDQQALGIATSLTAQEYFELLQERQAAREAIVRN